MFFTFERTPTTLLLFLDRHGLPVTLGLLLLRLLLCCEHNIRQQLGTGHRPYSTGVG